MSSAYLQSRLYQLFHMCCQDGENGGLIQELILLLEDPSPANTRIKKELFLECEKKADLGDSFALFLLSFFYVDGLNTVEPDCNKMFKYAQLSHNAGNSFGTNNLGWAYKGGVGVKADVKKGIELMENAGDRGNCISLYNLGVTYSNHGTFDLQKSFYYYEKAIETGDTYAEKNLNQLISVHETEWNDYTNHKRFVQENKHRLLVLLLIRHFCDTPFSGAWLPLEIFQEILKEAQIGFVLPPRKNKP